MLAVEMLAYAQPRLAICSCADIGDGPAPGAAPRAAPESGGVPAGAVPGTTQSVVAGTFSGLVPPLPNIKTTGTAFVACFGVLSVASSVTFKAGNAELSTRPTSCLVKTGMLPAVPSVVLVTVHVTFGIFFGRR